MSGLFEFADASRIARESMLQSEQLVSSALFGGLDIAPAGAPPFDPPFARSTPDISPATPKAPMSQLSLKIYQEPGSGDLLVEAALINATGAALRESDLHELEAVADSILLMMQQLSHGPYNAADLRRMNHPYGFDGGTGKARRVPRYDGSRSLGHRQGVRGSAPNLAVINKGSGLLADSWEHDLELTTDGARLRIRNTAKTQSGFSYPTALALGTDKMVAHGPFRYAIERNRSAFDAAWQRTLQRAWTRDQAEAAIMAGFADSARFVGGPFVGGVA